MKRQNEKRRQERRMVDVCELRVDGGGDGTGRTLIGYAAVFDSPTRIGVFDEVIRTGAFKRALNEEQDVRALLNHDSNWVLGRSKSGTLEMREDEKGLRVKIDPPRTVWADDLLESVSRGDINQMSFAFWPTREQWTTREDSDRDLREILDVDLYDVSVVTYPAYEQTSVDVRSADEVYREHIESENGDAQAGDAGEDDSAVQALEPLRLRIELDELSD